MEARIRQLNQILREAKVGTPPSADAGVAGPGMVVTVRTSTTTTRRPSSSAPAKKRPSPT